MCFEVAGTMLGSLVQGMAIALSRGNSNTACIQGGARTYDDTMEGAYRYGALTVAVVAVLAGLVPFFGVKEQRGRLGLVQRVRVIEEVLSKDHSSCSNGFVYFLVYTISVCVIVHY